MDNSSYSPHEFLRELQSSPLPAISAQGFWKSSGLNHGTAGASVQKSNPSLSFLPKDATHKKSLFNKLYTSQRTGPQAPVADQRGFKKNGGLGGTFDNGGRSKAISAFPLSQENSNPPRVHVHAGLVTSSPPLDVGVSDSPSMTSEAPLEAEDDDDVLGEQMVATGVRMQKKNKVLKEQIERLKQEYKQALQQRDRARASMAAAQSDLSNSSALVADLRRSLSDCESRVSESLKKEEETKEFLSGVQRQNDSLVAQLAERDSQNVHLREEGKKMGRFAQTLRLQVQERFAAFEELRERHKNLNMTCDVLRSEIQQLKSSSSEALQSNKILLGSDGSLTKIREFKAVIDELQTQLESSKEVITILRDKLHHMASVVVESKSRVDELEEEKRASFEKLHRDFEELKAQHELSVSLEKKTNELADRLVAREVETFDYLSTAVSLEERLEGAKTEISQLRSIISRSEAELMSVRAAEKEHMDKLLVAQEATSARDQELAILRAEVKSLSESKAELRVLWSESKQIILEKDQELLRRDMNSELETSIQDFRTQLGKLRLDEVDFRRKYVESQSQLHVASKELSALGMRMEEMQLATNAHLRTHEEVKAAQKAAYDSLLQEKVRMEESFDSQLSASRSELQEVQNSKNEQMKSFENALAEQKSTIDELVRETTLLKDRYDGEKRKLIDNHNREICRRQTMQTDLRASADQLEREKSSLEKSLEDALTRLDRRREEQSQLRTTFGEEREVLKDQFEAGLKAQRKLTRVQELRAESAENASAFAQKQFEAEQSKVLDLTSRINASALDLEHALQTVSNLEERLTCLQPTVNLADLQAQIEALSKDNEELRRQALQITERYHQGTLTDVEKDLVRHAMLIAASTHEETLVEKDQQIKMRDSQLAVLQQRVKVLEKTIAQMLGERAGDTRPIVNLQSLLASSPNDQEMNERKIDVDCSPPHVRVLGQGDVNASASTLTPVERVQPRYTKLAQLDSDSEVETPLSELTRMNDGSATKTKRMRLSSPVPAPAVPPKKRVVQKKNATCSKRASRSVAAAAADIKTSEDAGRGRQLKRK